MACFVICKWHRVHTRAHTHKQTITQYIYLFIYICIEIGTGVFSRGLNEEGLSLTTDVQLALWFRMSRTISLLHHCAFMTFYRVKFTCIRKCDLISKRLVWESYLIIKITFIRHVGLHGHLL